MKSQRITNVIIYAKVGMNVISEFQQFKKVKIFDSKPNVYLIVGLELPLRDYKMAVHPKYLKKISVWTKMVHRPQAIPQAWINIIHLT